MLDKAYSLSLQLKNERNKRLTREQELAKIWAEHLLKQVETIKGVNVLIARVPPARLEILREIADFLRDKLKSVLLVLGSVDENKPVFLTAVTSDLVEKGYDAGDIVEQVAAVTGGGGGGKASFGQGSGKFKDKLDEALRVAKDMI